MLFSSTLRACAMALLCICIKTAQAHAALFPGDQRTQMRNGKEIWATGGKTTRAQETVFFVRDYGILRPKLVYKGRIVPALCKTAERYLGVGVRTAQFHFDMNDERGKARRKLTGCTGTWIDTHGCPEADQPNWWFNHEGVTAVGPIEAVLSQRGGVTSNNRLGFTETDYDENMVPTVEWYDFGATFSCDEFPAATWIEGGSARGTLNPKAAATYCAPKQSNCIGANKPPPQFNTDYATGVVTDQGWQGSGIGQIRTWLDKLVQLAARTRNDDFSIFKIDFQMDNFPNTEYAVWVEANGVKRYCYGLPTTESCINGLLSTDPVPNNNRIDW